MANACFRCKTPIESGATFCRSCRDVASLEFPYTRDSRLWLVVLGAPVVGLLAVVAAVAYGLAGGSLAGALAAAVPVAWLLTLPFAYALYRDCQHVRRRDDAEWNPSEWLYAFLAPGCVLLVLPTYLVGPYHCYRRETAIGLAW